MKRNHIDRLVSIDWLGVLFFLWIAIMFGTVFGLNATQGDWR